MGGPGAILSPESVRVIERRFRVVSMRRDGYTVQEIANTVQCDINTVRKDLIEVLDQCVHETSETTEENRQLAIDRLDGLLKEYYQEALSHPGINPDGSPCIIPGNMSAAALVLQIEMRRAKLLALDVPEQKAEVGTGVREYIGVDMDQI